MSTNPLPHDECCSYLAQLAAAETRPRYKAHLYMMAWIEACHSVLEAVPAKREGATGVMKRLLEASEHWALVAERAQRQPLPVSAASQTSVETKLEP